MEAHQQQKVANTVLHTTQEVRRQANKLMFIFVLLGKNIGVQTATRIHEQKA